MNLIVSSLAALLISGTQPIQLPQAPAQVIQQLSQRCMAEGILVETTATQVRCEAKLDENAIHFRH